MQSLNIKLMEMLFVKVDGIFHFHVYFSIRLAYSKANHPIPSDIWRM